MKRFPFRPIFAGILIGTAIFFAPFFLFRAALFILIIGGLFRLFGRRWYGMHYRHGGFPQHYGSMGDGPNIINLRSRDVADIAID